MKRRFSTRANYSEKDNPTNQSGQNMKRAYLIVLLLVMINPGFIIAQETVAPAKKGKIGITYSSFGENYVIMFTRLLGNASYDSDYFFTAGITWVTPLKKGLELETGLDYSRHSIIIIPNLPPEDDNTPRKVKFSLINIPVTFRANFLKYFFVNGGLFVDIDPSINSWVNNMTGIGSLLGFAAKYDFNSGISVFVNPYTKIHSLIPLGGWVYHQRLLENGIRIGVTYDLSKTK